MKYEFLFQQPKHFIDFQKQDYVSRLILVPDMHHNCNNLSIVIILDIASCNEEK